MPLPRDASDGPAEVAERGAGDAATVPPTLRRAAAWSWRLLVVLAAVVAGLYVVGRALPVVLPIVGGLLLARALSPIDRWLRRRGLRPGLAAGLTMLAFLVVLGGVLGGIGLSVVAELDDVGATISEGLDDVERWLVEDSPFDVDPADLRGWREDVVDRIAEIAGSRSDSIASGAVLAGEVAVGAVLALILAFFFLKDRDRLREWALSPFSPARAERYERMGARAWAALGGYLRGAAGLGIVEGAAIGLVMLLVGAQLILPVMVLTFLGAFVPIVGAIFAGVVAVLVTLATAGVPAALVAAGVALLVQQFDNDLLAPVVYGKALQLRPLAVLLGIATGTALFGFVGTILAVPVLAVAVNAYAESRRPPGGDVADVPAVPAVADPASRPDGA